MTPEQEIRAKALELAIMNSPDASAEELKDIAAFFAEYITGPAPVPGQAFDSTEEPPIGRYLDRDGDDWERTARGWHHEGKSRAQSWGWVAKFAPFTKLKD